MLFIVCIVTDLIKVNGESVDLKGEIIRTVFKDDPAFIHKYMEPGKEFSSPHNMNKVKWSGFIPEIYEGLAKMFNFKYQLFKPTDDKWGSFDNLTGNWNGMIRDLLDDKADVALGLVGTSLRSNYTDLSLPFFTFSYVFFVSSVDSEFSYFMYFKPFSRDVWCITIFIILFSSLIMYITVNFNLDRSVSEFSLRKCFTFTFGAYGVFTSHRWGIAPSGNPGRYIYEENRKQAEAELGQVQLNWVLVFHGSTKG